MKYTLRYARVVILERDVEAENSADAAAKISDLEAGARLGIQSVAPILGSRAVEITDYDVIWELTQDQSADLFPNDNNLEEALADKLIGYWGHWGDHPQYERADWQMEASANDTSLGYWMWVANHIINYEENVEGLVCPDCGHEYCYLDDHKAICRVCDFEGDPEEFKPKEYEDGE